MGEGDEGERGREGRREGEKRGQKWESMKWIGKRRKATVCRLLFDVCCLGNSQVRGRGVGQLRERETWVRRGDIVGMMQRDLADR